MNPLAGRIRLDFRAEEPIYLQIVRQIEALVAEGTLKPGDQLPTVRELAIDLRINFSTVARAYRILDDQRLISTQRGRGTYIWDEAPPGPEQQEVTARQEVAAQQEVVAPNPGEHQVMERSVMTEKLAGLAQRFIREAAETGATAEQIEQVFHQELDGWKQNHPAYTGKNMKG